MPATSDQILRELRHLRDDIKVLQEALIPEVNPIREEKKAINAGRREVRRGQHIEWEKLRRELRK